MPTIDYRELARFVVSGGVATLGNLAAVWTVRQVAPFAVALTAGIVVGATISFLLSKLFAFRSREWSAAGGEARRFLLVYLGGLAIYTGTAMLLREPLRHAGLPRAWAEMLAVLCGAGLMVVSGYLGHRFYTYRS